MSEFAIKSFDEASLTTVLKDLGIAKGSLYQYFDNKLDLFLYLINECNTTKMKYLGTIKRESHPDYWSFFRALYECGFRFDQENPLQSHFLFNLIENLNSPTIKHLYDDMLEQSVMAFEQMINHEISLGLFRDDIPTKTMAYMMYKSGSSIQEQLIFSKVINPKENIKEHQAVYQGKETELMQTVDDYIRLMKPSFDKQNS